MNDPTIIPVTIVLLIVLAVAYHQRLYWIMGLILVSYLFYLIFAIDTGNVAPVDYTPEHELTSVSVPPEKLIGSPAPTVVETTIIQDTIITDTRIAETAPDTDDESGRIEKSLQLNSVMIAREIDVRTPVGTDTVFDNSINKLYCFTGITNPYQESRDIVHFWKYRGRYIAKVDITVGPSFNWRCWSSVTIQPEWIGPWEVEILDSKAVTLGTTYFSIITNDSL